jgi:hypothetical protein
MLAAEMPHWRYVAARAEEVFEELCREIACARLAAISELVIARGPLGADRDELADVALEYMRIKALHTLAKTRREAAQEIRLLDWTRWSAAMLGVEFSGSGAAKRAEDYKRQLDAVLGVAQARAAVESTEQ